MPLPYCVKYGRQPEALDIPAKVGPSKPTAGPKGLWPACLGGEAPKLAKLNPSPLKQGKASH